VVLDFAGAEGIVGANRRTRRAIARGQLRRQPLKRGLLVAPKDTWPRFDGGISMELAGTANDGSQIFRYTHSAAYQARAQALPRQAQVVCVCRATLRPAETLPIEPQVADLSCVTMPFAGSAGPF
jgi:hypothetical protein